MKQPNTDILEALITSAMQAGDWATVDDLEPRLDAVCQPKTPPTIVASALWYAEHDLHVFPLQPRSKMPYKGSRGLKDASIDRDEIVAWWQRWPDSNVAIATGHQVDVIDIDGIRGAESWARTTDVTTIIGVVSTPRPGGSHLYLKASGLKNGAKLLPGIDVRGQGGYVCAPPSQLKEIRKPNGEIDQYAGIYKWRYPLDFNHVLPPLANPVHDDNLCHQCGHPLNVEPHPEHHLKG